MPDHASAKRHGVRSCTAVFVAECILHMAVAALFANVSWAVDVADGREVAAGSYNKPWGENRGFAVGQTLPDIPLIDLDGNEVRFSAFLGKRYVLFCWASW